VEDLRISLSYDDLDLDGLGTLGIGLVGTAHITEEAETFEVAATFKLVQGQGNELTLTVAGEVEGEGMRLISAGEGPSVVLEAGAAGDHRTWSAVHPLLSASFRVVSYDRMGMGGSGPSPRPRTSAVIAEQLREALRQAEVAPPFFLVGHSFGGALMRVFAARYQDEVAGLVLVDPAMEDFYTRAAAEQPAAYLAQLEEEILWSDGIASEGVRREFLAYETSMMQARAARLAPDLPVTVITATEMELPPELRAVWVAAQRDWVAEHPGVRQMLVDDGHRIPQQMPEIVARAVADLVDSAGSWRR
jgi:pimeloyl-ACP methyl ester carboxylesterase